MKRLICLLLLAAMALSMVACNSVERPYIPTGNGLSSDTTGLPTLPDSGVEQQLQLVYYPEKTLNPYQLADHTNKVLLPLLYQGLFSVDREYNVTPILCRAYTVSADMLVYTFYLEAATFSDGSVLKAADVVQSLLAAKAGPVYSGRLKAVTEIYATQDGAVELQLSTPYENLPLLLDIPIVKETHVGADTPMGTGAYFLQDSMEGKPGLQRRTDWWCRSTLAVTASFIPLVTGKTPYQIRNEFEYGNISLVCTDPGSDNFVDFRNDHEVWQCENGIFLYLGVNEKSKVFSIEAVRQALTHAIDRDALVEEYYRGFAMAATLPASPAFPYYNKALAGQYGYREGVMQQALADAKLEAPAITLLVNKADSRRVRAARAIVQMLTDCGMQVTLSSLSGTSYTNALKKGNYDLHLGQTILSPNMDLSAFFADKGTLGYGGMTDAAIHSLCQEAMANSGNYYTLHKTVMEDAMLCPILMRSYAVYGARGCIPSLAPARDNLFFYTIGKTLEDIKQ